MINQQPVTDYVQPNSETEPMNLSNPDSASGHTSQPAVVKNEAIEKEVSLEPVNLSSGPCFKRMPTPDKENVTGEAETQDKQGTPMEKPGGIDDDGVGKEDEEVGKEDEEVGKEDEPVGKEDEPVGKDDEPVGKDDEVVKLLSTLYASNTTKDVVIQKEEAVVEKESESEEDTVKAPPKKKSRKTKEDLPIAKAKTERKSNRKKKR